MILISTQCVDMELYMLSWMFKGSLWSIKQLQIYQNYKTIARTKHSTAPYIKNVHTLSYLFSKTSTTCVPPPDLSVRLPLSVSGVLSGYCRNISHVSRPPAGTSAVLFGPQERPYPHSRQSGYPMYLITAKLRTPWVVTVTYFLEN